MDEEDMDFHELIAWDLETAQQKRYKKAGCSDEFWTPKEASIFESIKEFREKSSTFDPMKAR